MHSINRIRSGIVNAYVNQEDDIAILIDLGMPPNRELVYQIAREAKGRIDNTNAWKYGTYSRIDRHLFSGNGLDQRRRFDAFLHAFETRFLKPLAWLSNSAHMVLICRVSQCVRRPVFFKTKKCADKISAFGDMQIHFGHGKLAINQPWRR